MMDTSALPCFYCLGGVNPRDPVLHPKGILRRKHYLKFVTDDVPRIPTNDLHVFFECDYDDDTSVSANLNTLFHIARKLERHEAHPEENDLVHQLLQCVRDLVLYMGTLSGLPRHVISCMASTQGNKSLSLSYHFTHMNLDVRWSLLTILSDLSPFLDRNPHVLENISFLPQPTVAQNELNCPSPFEQYVRLILWDVVGMALHIFRKITLSEFHLITPFPCSCVKELVVLVGKVLDWRSDGKRKESFSITLHRIFKVILQEKPSDSVPETNERDNLDSVDLNLIPDFCGADKLGFCWWLLLHLAPLGEIDDYGNVYTPNHAVYKGDHSEMAHLCKLTTQSESYRCTESQLRCYLRCCLAMCQKWEASMEAPLVLWEYFYRRLNDLFMDVGEVTVPGHGKSGLALFKHILTLIEDNNDFEVNFSSYQLFLRFMCLQLKKSLASGSQREWKNLKGRIFSKFHPRKMKELSPSGLQNCMCLFLGVAALTDLPDVADKMCDLLEMINPTVMELAKHSLIWRALFALMLIYEKEGKNLAIPAESMVKKFNAVAGGLTWRQNGPLQSFFPSELLHVYMEGMQDVFEHSSTLNLSEYILVAGSFHDVLIQANVSDLEIALGAVEVILSRCRIMHQRRLRMEHGCVEAAGPPLNFRHLEGLAEAIWDHVFPFLRDNVLGEANAKLVAEVAASATLFVLDVPPNPVSAVRETFSSMMEDFGLGLQARAEVCCDYLTNMLSHPDLLERPTVAGLVNYQAQLIRAWLRLGVQIAADRMRELTRLILRLPEMMKVFADSHMALPFSDEYNEAVKWFLKVLAIRQNTMDFNSRIAAKQATAFYFADIMRVANINFKGSNSPEALASVYSLVGRMMKTIPSLIYVPSKHDCVFCEIVETAILPHYIRNPDSPIQPNLLNALRDYLPQFVLGISSLNYRRDSYIGQTLKSVFTNYLPRFQLKGAGTSVHPLVVSLLTVLRRHPNGLDVVHFVIDVVREAYLGTRGASLNLGINFIHELLICISPKDCSTTSAILLPPLFKILVLLEESLAKQRSLDIVKLVMDSCLTQEDENCRSSVEDTLKEAIRQHFGSHTDRVFTLLRTLARMYLKPVANLLPFIAEQVGDTEMRQGCGTNGTLRSKLREFALDVEAGFKLRRQDY